ncbi:helix-turn-helix domain-containing protein [Paenalkalicoccus suaedae]|uniref:Helix-turn-helix domain-containing protein n=1 Tax=Paenalkalicoccus suaedae TaxID=2592382 RepID=A0A859FJ84_9BACI|nr:helix-turn-helix domain-containing protein [Paenalkalicoccus suaedae]QKS72646.1 helix-turn-helix domain-containing protein [Paenalkalicoccus suaedae]
MIKKVRDVAELISTTFSLDVRVVDGNGATVLEHGKDRVANPVYPTKQALLSGCGFEFVEQKTMPFVHLSPFAESYLLQNIEDVGVMIVGPSVSQRLTPAELTGIVRDQKLLVNRYVMQDFYDSLPVHSKSELRHIARMLHYLLFEKRIEESEILSSDQMKAGDLNSTATTLHPTMMLAKQKQELIFHQDPLLEKKFSDLLQKGQPEKLEAYMKSLPKMQLGVLATTSFLRNKKNLGIAGITIATRSAMAGGVNSEEAYTLSDHYIQRIEEITDYARIDALLSEAYLTFARLVEKRRYSRHKREIILAQNYVLNHVYEKLTLKKVATAVSLNPSYLSSLFSRESGQSLSAYILEARINEAKSLLTMTDSPISEICAWLQFNDQSYFTKVFKQAVGVTPKKYRDGVG